MALGYFYTFFKDREKRVPYKWLTGLAVLGLICWPDWQDLAARKSARHYFFVGKHYENTGQLHKAAGAYEKSMEAYPWDADSPYRLGLILARQGQNQRAVEYLKEALQREPDFPEVFNELARHHIRAGDLIAAEKQLIASLNLAPAKADSLILMAQLQRRAGDSRREIAYFKDAATKTGRHRPAILLADRFIELGNYEDAVGRCRLNSSMAACQKKNSGGGLAIHRTGKCQPNMLSG